MKMFLCASMMLILLLKPQVSRQAAVNALAVWGFDVVPSLFPYMVLCQNLSSLPLNKRSAKTIAFLLGLFGGSPSASASLVALAQSKAFSKRLFSLLLSVCGTISPMFFLGPVAKWFSSTRIACFLLISQYVGAVFAGGIFSYSSSFDLRINESTSFSDIESNPISRSIHAVLNVGGCIVFYSTASICIETIIPLFSPLFSVSVHAVLEISGGIHNLAASALPSNTKYLLAAGLCGFGGISILSQNLFFLKPMGIRTKDLTLLALLRGLFASCSMLFLLLMQALV